MLKRLAAFLFAAASVALLVCALLTMSGCAAHPPTGGQQIAGEALARADVRQTYILDEAKIVKPADAGKRITTFAKDTRKDIEQAAQGNDMQASELRAANERYAKLDGRWYVWAGRKIQTLAIAAGVLWLAIGLFGGFFAGPGFVGGLARHALNFLPLAHPFTAIARVRAAQ
jgi:hypothetical protein